MISFNNKIFFWIFTGSIILMLSGCAAKKYARIASKYEQAEMYRLAVENYMLSLKKKNDKNDDARIGLMRSSKRYSDELEQKINEAYAYLNDDLVVQHFLELINLQQKAASFSVDLDISLKTQGQFEEAKSRHLRVIYTKAQEFLDKERFHEAEIQLAEVIRIDNRYERAAELYIFSRCEPLYRTAKQHLQNKLYRSAYHALTNLMLIDANFKDAATLRIDAYYHALLTIAIKPFANERYYPHLANQIKQDVKIEFDKRTNPLLVIVAPDYTQQIIAEQKKALANNIAFDARQIIPVRAYLGGNIVGSQYAVSKLMTAEKKGFLRYMDEFKQIKFTKVVYYEYEQSCSASIKCNYEFVSAQNASLLAFGNIERNYTDYVRYARANYDVRELFPGNWGIGVEDFIITDITAVNATRQLFQARSNLYDLSYFEKSFANTAAVDMLKKISAYDPEK